MEATTINGQPRIFYGWYIVVVSFLCWFAADAFGWYTFGIFLGPITTELGWTTTMMTLALTIRTVVAGMSGPLIGPLADTKHGARVLMSMGVIVAGIIPMIVSRIHTLWEYYLFYGVIGALGMVGYGGLVTNTIIAKWFVCKRGRAMGISTLGVSVCGVVFVPLSHFLISHIGWRSTLVIFGLIIWGVTVIPVTLLVRRRPEDLGLLPDGDDPYMEGTEITRLSENEAVSAGERIWTLGDALRTKSLWLLLVGFNLAGLPMSGAMIHLFPYLETKGFSKEIAAGALTVFAFCAALVKIPWGLIAERVPVRNCIIACYTGCAFGLLILLTSNSVFLIFLYAVVYGMALGGDMVLRELIWANYYGRTFLGKIRGVIMPANVASMAGGPLLAAWLYDLTGNYQIPYALYLIAFIIGIFFIYLARPPKEKN